MSIKITSLELENVKRVRTVAFSPAQTGLTTIGGNNAQGKTSILDAITYALGGEKYRPSNLQREGSSAEANIKLTLSNGLIVERGGKNAALKVIDPTGQKAGQRLLDSFVEELALNLPKFMAMNGKDKADVLLSILGIEKQLAAIDAEEKAAYDERTIQGRVADQKEKYAAEMPEWHDVPEDVQTPEALVKASQAIMTRNAQRENQRNQLVELERKVKQADTITEQKISRVAELEKMLNDAKKDAAAAAKQADELASIVKEAKTEPADPDESTIEVEAKLAELELINSKVRANNDKRKAIEDAENARSFYESLSVVVEEVRAKRLALLDSVKLPLPGLNVEAGELLYQGQKWDCMSGMEKIRVAAAIVKQRKPECGFVLLDGLEVFDRVQLAELSNWLEAENLQAIATRVSTGDECSIIIEDGLIVASAAAQEAVKIAGEMDY